MQTDCYILRNYSLCLILTFSGPGMPLNCIPGNPGFNSSPPNPLGLPCSGTTVFPLPGSFPWTAGNRGIEEYRLIDLFHLNGIMRLWANYVFKNIWFIFTGLFLGKPRRGMLRRAVFSDYQRKGLEKRFQVQKYISKPDRKKLAEKLGLKDSQVSYHLNICYVSWLVR